MNNKSNLLLLKKKAVLDDFILLSTHKIILS